MVVLFIFLGLNPDNDSYHFLLLSILMSHGNHGLCILYKFLFSAFSEQIIQSNQLQAKRKSKTGSFQSINKGLGSQTLFMPDYQIFYHQKEFIKKQKSMLLRVIQLLHNLNPFLLYRNQILQIYNRFLDQQFTIMKLFFNNRQRLTINRAKKPSTPTKISMEVINSVKLDTIHNPLANKDTNATKSGNSSIFRKQVENQAERRQRLSRDLIRCRSISRMGNNNRSNGKAIPSLKKLNISTLDQKPIKIRMLEQIIEDSCDNMMSRLKQRGILASKKNYYYISEDIFNNMATELAERIILQTRKTRKNILSDIFANKDTEASVCSEKHEPNLRVFNQFSINEHLSRKNKLSFEAFNLSIHLQYEQCTQQREFFWKIMESIDVEIPTEQKVNSLVGKNKYLKEEIANRELQLKRINQIIEKQNKNIESKNEEIQMLQQQVRQHENSLHQVQKAVKEIQSFVNKQPNKILQQEAQGYKQRQQELFDLAFMLEQSAPSSIAIFIQESIMIPFESFKLTLKTFPHGSSDQESFVISKKDMDSFKASIDSAYESTVEKLKIVIEKKASKIKNFVGIMRRLASYTIGKRQYLTQINKKMAIVSVSVEKKLKIIEQCCKQHCEGSEKFQIFMDLRQLFNSIRNIYYQAEVFY